MPEPTKNSSVRIPVIIVCVEAILLFVIVFFLINRWNVSISLNGPNTLVHEYGTEYIEEGASARLYGSLFFKKGFPIPVSYKKNIDLSQTGPITLSYSTNVFGLSDSKTRTITVVDTKAPEIILTTIEGSFTIPGEDYKEEGFQATDNYDGDLTNQVVVTKTDSTVTYQVSDSSGNQTEVTRTIVYFDPIAPELTLEGEDTITLLVGTEYEEPGYFAKDNCDGDLTNQVVVETDLDCTVVGEYTITYTVSDSYNNITTQTRTVCYIDDFPPELTLTGGIELTITFGTIFEEPGYTAIDNYDGDLTEDVIVTGSVDSDQLGTYTLTYEVADSNGNTTTMERIVSIVDDKAPELILEGESKIVQNVGTTYVEPGYTAIDNYDGNITDKVVVTGSVNMNEPGTYILTYSVTDTHGNTSTLKRTIVSHDSVPPTLTLNGKTELTIHAGEVYTEPGYAAHDNIQGDLTSSVKVNGYVNRYHAGTYTLTYSVSDSSGNTVTAQRTVTVKPIRQADTITPEGKVVYLTFDDGPSKHTLKLLDILNTYNVKATFFVVNTSYPEIMKDIVANGHTIALHSYTHSYPTIYASEEAYFNDMRQIQSLVYEQTGVLSKMIRFPGGSSNKVSTTYCKGIMTSLAEALANMGYQYYDWNVGSQDTGGAKTPETVAQNVINGIQKHDISIVLQHDIYEYSVDAVEKIIIWGLEHGYTFLPLDETSPGAHHTIVN